MQVLHLCCHHRGIGLFCNWDSQLCLLLLCSLKPVVTLGQYIRFSKCVLCDFAYLIGFVVDLLV